MNFQERKAELDSSRIPGHSSHEDSSTFSVIWQEALVPETQFKDARMSGQQQASILVSKQEAVNMVPSLTVILQCCQLVDEKESRRCHVPPFESPADTQRC